MAFVRLTPCGNMLYPITIPVDTGRKGRQRFVFAFHVLNVDAAATRLILKSECETGCPFGELVRRCGHFFKCVTSTMMVARSVQMRGVFPAGLPPRH